ncbi:hypothetical protein GCM10009839_15680 [Catenulispora yoronensis]|uniref:DUF4440 domain-containing protein n=1 Tax=Catenulispora yoronensis TaxID=450799 RepID=A0ABN2TUT3_9ACTN
MGSEYSAEAVQAVQAVFDTMTATWAEADAARFAACYSDEATVIGPGILLRGRDDISRSMAAAFAGPLKGSLRPHTTQSVRFLSDGRNAIVVTASETVLPGEAATPADRKHLVTWFLARHDDRWLIEANHICQA